MHLDYLASQIRIFEPFAHHVEEVGDPVLHMKNDAGRIVTKLPSAHRRVPAYDQPVALLPPRRLVIRGEQVPFDEVAARSDWFLLELGGKID